MPLNPRPFHGADHTPPAADGPQDGFRDWSRRVGGLARGPARARAPRPEPLGVEPIHPLLKLAAVAFVGYTLGRLVHRASTPAASKAPATASRPPSRPPIALPPRPPQREPRSSVRFR